jgi:hypothetical protein
MRELLGDPTEKEEGPTDIMTMENLQETASVVFDPTGHCAPGLSARDARHAFGVKVVLHVNGEDIARRAGTRSA